MNITYTLRWRAEGELESKNTFDRDPLGHIEFIASHRIDDHIRGHVSMSVAAWTVEQLMNQKNQDLSTALIILATRDVEQYLKEEHNIDTEVYI